MVNNVLVVLESVDRLLVMKCQEFFHVVSHRVTLFETSGILYDPYVGRQRFPVEHPKQICQVLQQLMEQWLIREEDGLVAVAVSGGIGRVI